MLKCFQYPYTPSGALAIYISVIVIALLNVLVEYAHSRYIEDLGLMTWPCSSLLE